MGLEGAARHLDSADYGFYEFDVNSPGEEPAVADAGPVIRAVVADMLAGTPPAVVAGRFHAGVVALIAGLADLCRRQSGLDVVALGGGVFQNTLLIDGAQRALRERGFTVLRPRLLPPNDGGIALGQLAVGASG
jgi:hydrogenase maturation protein HypF